LLRKLDITDDEDDIPPAIPSQAASPSTLAEPWRKEFQLYLETIDELRDNSVI
jgi:hypothetical protein